MADQWAQFVLSDVQLVTLQRYSEQAVYQEEIAGLARRSAIMAAELVQLYKQVIGVPPDMPAEIRGGKLLVRVPEPEPETAESSAAALQAVDSILRQEDTP